jgi:hypothetical protein
MWVWSASRAARGGRVRRRVEHGDHAEQLLQGVGVLLVVLVVGVEAAEREAGRGNVRCARHSRAISRSARR